MLQLSPAKPGDPAKHCPNPNPNPIPTETFVMDTPTMRLLSSSNLLDSSMVLGVGVDMV